MQLMDVETAVIASTLSATNMEKDKFESLTLPKKREIANTYVTASVVPNGEHSMGRLVIEVKS